MNNKLWRIFMIPSAYGFLLWIFLLLIVNLNLIKVDISLSAYLVLTYVVVCFGISSTVTYRMFQSIQVQSIRLKIKKNKYDIFLFFSSTLIGLIGLYLYILDFSSFFGGFQAFFLTFFNEPLMIRALAADESSFGVQLSYFSWLSIFYCIFILSTDVSMSNKYKIIIAVVLLLEFSLNLLFIDRTRPVILFLVCALILLVLKAKSFKNPFKIIPYVFIGPVIIFFIQAAFTEKYDKDDGLFDNFLIYVFSGFGYFSAALDQVVPDYQFTRTFYPLAKILEAIGFPLDVPSQILDFKNVPFTTNVGTFLEPLLSDGGVLFVILGTPLIIFIVDILAYRAITSRTVVGLFFWANLVLISIFSFFVPKYNATYFYLFLIIYLSGFVVRLRVHQ